MAQRWFDVGRKSQKLLQEVNNNSPLEGDLHDVRCEIGPLKRRSDRGDIPLSTETEMRLGTHDRSLYGDVVIARRDPLAARRMRSGVTGGVQEGQSAPL